LNRISFLIKTNWAAIYKTTKKEEKVTVFRIDISCSLWLLEDMVKGQLEGDKKSKI